jgi:Zn-dependent M28 family amino/carboxypeptidase
MTELAATNLSPAAAADQLFSMAQHHAPLGARIPVAYLSRSAFEVAKRMVGLEVRVAVGHQAASGDDAGTILGLLPTSSATPQDGLVVIGAHHDHVGSNADGVIWNGADDNASGVVGLLALVEHFQRQGFGLDRDILFVAFSGEERGLLGSFDLFASGRLDPESVHLMLNLDMIGRAGSGRIAAIGVGSSPPLLQMAKRHAEDSPLDVVFDDETMFDRSDHLPFYLLGIPVLFLNSGEHADYHTPQDLWDRVDLPALRQILLYASALLEEAAGHPTELPFHDYLRRRSARFGSPPRTALPWPIPFRQRLDY